jgi:hypothetical protein
MKTHKAVLVLSLAALVAGLLAPAAVVADPGRQGGPHQLGGPHQQGGRHFVMAPGLGHVSPQRHFHRPFVRRFPYASPYFYGTGYYAPSAFYGSSLGYDYGSSGGYDPPMAYAPPPAYTAYSPPPAYGSAPSVPFSTTTFVPEPARPGVIEYPTGRYELRGDGINTPHVWVWIPNPPPPPESAPAGPTGTRGAPSPPPWASEAPSPRRSQLYRWVDEQGVVHLTDNPESVPPQYRKPAARAQGGAS